MAPGAYLHMDLGSEELYALAMQAEGQLSGPEQAAWLDRLDGEREPLYALLELLIAAGDSDRALRLAGALARFWWMRGQATSGRERIRSVLAMPGGSDAARASALVGAGSLAYAVGDFLGARRHHEQALKLLRTADRELDRADALDQAGMAARQLMALTDAQTLHTEALEIQRRIGAPAAVARSLNNLGVVAFFQGELDTARAYHQEALTLREQAGDVRGRASSLNNLGQVARFAGDFAVDFAVARAYIEYGLNLRRQLGDRWGMAGSQVNLAVVCAHLGDLAVARSQLSDAVSGFQTVGDPLGICECLEAGADLAIAEERAMDAVSLYSSATQRREQLLAPRFPLLDRSVVAALAELRARLGEEGYGVAWRDGYETADAAPERFL
jgi:tetratricopeptide (TPR) repeat protein